MIPGYVPNANETDTTKLARSIRNLYENGASANAVQRISGGLTPRERLLITRATVATVRIQADAIILFDSDGNAKRYESIDVTLNITASGALGLDTGSEAVSTWYHLWGIGSDDGTFSGTFSTSSTDPTEPSGYRYKGYLGAVYNSSGSDLVDMLQRDNRVTVALSNPKVNGSDTSATLIDLAAYIPTTAVAIDLKIQPSTSAGTADVQVVITGNATTTVLRTISFPSLSTSVYRTEMSSVLLETPQAIYYRVAGTNAQTTISIVGYNF